MKAVRVVRLGGQNLPIPVRCLVQPASPMLLERILKDVKGVVMWGRQSCGHGLGLVVE
jgi:hypothetical protein